MFTLLSWNVLADAYVRAAHYPQTPAHLLAGGARTAAIVERLAACHADVICLQEAEPPLVDAARARLERYGLWYLRKRGGKPDGCATFVRGLAVQSVEEIVYADGDPPSGHVALALEVEHDGTRIGIVNTHLKWDPPDSAPSSRFAKRQIAQLLSAMNGEIPWIVCGDFNLTPEDYANAAFDQAGLADAYAGSQHEAPTVVTNGRAKRIDFIRHSVALSVQGLPTVRVGDSTALPSEEQPSDHVAIGARVAVASRRARAALEA
jgi:endonuclease/exonuclease/phosphatase family metal-dependent hydrolase